MTLSLREQLLAAGLGTKKQAKKIEQHQRQQQYRKADVAEKSEQQRAEAQAKAAKAARDQELNRKRQEQAEHRARWAQVKQLIEQNVVARADCEECFNFVDRGKVRRIYINAELREKIINGTLVIVRCEGRYHVVAADVATRIGEREPRAVVALNQTANASSEAAENDPYKDFVVPDDLKW